MANHSRLKTWSTLAIVLAAAAAGASCGDVVRQGRGSSYVILNNLEAASGADPTKFSNTLGSDVLTLVKKQIGGVTVYVPTIFEDVGRVQVSLANKNVTSSTTDNNLVTFTRYHVTYKRADGRNVPGVDVPYGFDGAVTFTVTPNGSAANFTIVRVQAKEEAPLIQLVDAGTAYSISTIAEITFYGKDQVGNDVQVTGQISINFANWGDPE